MKDALCIDCYGRGRSTPADTIVNGTALCMPHGHAEREMTKGERRT